MERIFWNLYSFLYDLVCRLIPYKEMVAQVVREIPEATERVLDAGCGTGTLATVLLNQGKSIQYEGIDASHFMLKKARRKNPQGNFLYGDLTKPLPYANGSFDCVVSINVLYALPNPQETIAEFRRILKPDGTLIICTPLSGTDPRVIFSDHLKREGWLKTLPYLLPLIVLGLMNIVILQRSGSGAYHFFSKEEIEALIRCRKLTKTYAGQDWLAVGT